MNKKIIFQIFVFFIIFLFTAFLFYQYSLNESAQTSDTSNNDINLDLAKEPSNLISNIKYKSFDGTGNQYKIKAKSGAISDGNPNIIIMQDVEAEIIFNNNEKIFITALYAKYNIINYDTIFEDNVEIKYIDHYLICDNSDLFFKENKIKLYNNINYTNLDTSVLADEMEINLLTKNLKIYMINQDQKIKVIYKNNVGN